MKSLFLFILILLIYAVTPAQPRPANLEISITVFDNSGMPNNPGNLIIGIDSAATDSIDSFLGEALIFCPWDNAYSDCQPWDHFEVILDVPSPPSSLWGTHKDIRRGVLPYTGQKVHKLIWGAHSTADTMFILWDFPPGVTANLRDWLTGNLVNYYMSGSGRYSNPVFMQLQGSPFLLFVNYDNAVPVELASFEASAAGSEVLLKWSTSSETNNKGFEIERSSPLPYGGQSEDWRRIGFIEGKATTAEKQYYTFTDLDAPSGGSVLYRLKQIDFDGRFNYSNIISVDLLPPVPAIIQNYPNPFNPVTTIAYSIPELCLVTIKVFDILGNEIETLVTEKKPAGTYELTWNAADLPSGVYYYRLQAGGYVETNKMMLLK